MRYIRITDITFDGKLKSDGCKYLSSEVGRNYPVKKGDVLLARSGATVGKAFIYDEDNDACYAGYLIKASVQQEKVSPQFFFYFTQTSQYDEWKNRIFIQATIQNISAEKYARMSLCIPPLSEQHSIVSFLDDKCGKIDKMLEGKQKQIELLAEMKQRIIADAVTRGLNPDVKMKATNIPWLPEIPEHWRVIRNKWLFKEEDEKNIDLSYQLLSFSRNKGIIPFSENTDKAPSASDLSKYKILHKGQLLENRMQAWSGMFGCSFIEGCVSPDYSVFSPLDGANTEYYAHLFRTPLYVQQFANASKGIGDGFNRLYTPQFQRIYAICPPLSEQLAIVSYITDKTAKIDALTGKLQQEIESIKEYKQRLISDVVTGQIKVC